MPLCLGRVVFLKGRSSSGSAPLCHAGECAVTDAGVAVGDGKETASAVLPKERVCLSIFVMCVSVYSEPVLMV